MKLRIAVLGLIMAVCGGCAGILPVTPGGTLVSLTITPSSASLAPGATAKFSAAVSGTSNTSVLWTATGGTIAGDGTYTAGSNAGSFSVTATSSADPSRSAKATVTITTSPTPTPTPTPTPVVVTIQPSTATLQTGQSQQFTASVTGTSNTTVTWQASSGTINGSGKFTAGSQAGTVTITAISQADTKAQATAHVTVTVAPPPPPPPPPTQARLFASAGADWLYNPPTGQGQDISKTTSKLGFAMNISYVFGYPVVYTDGSHGCTTFTDTRIYNYHDNICVPNPPNGYYPSLGGWGANDGHLVVVDTVTLMYYDFWKLMTDGSGHPTSTNVGRIVSGNLKTSNGTPGTTAANITGLAGDIMPGELDCVNCLQHALNMVVPGSMNSTQLGTQGPVFITDGSVANAPFREGAKFRFDPSVNVDALPASTAVKAIMKALQKYGGLITDQTGANAVLVYSSIPKLPDMTGQNLINQHLLIYY